MPVKILMTWDIAAEHEQEYFEFVIGEFVPGVQRLGLQPAEAWATLYGSYPQIQVVLAGRQCAAGPQCPGIQRLDDASGPAFHYIRNYSYKIVPSRWGFQF